MIQIDEQKLRQLFKNRSNCYADAEDVVQAMDEDCFIETVNEALRLFAVSGQSEQLCDFLEWYDEKLTLEEREMDIKTYLDMKSHCA